jgi:hypothetical protein
MSSNLEVNLNHIYIKSLTFLIPIQILNYSSLFIKVYPLSDHPLIINSINNLPEY